MSGAPDSGFTGIHVSLQVAGQDIEQDFSRPFQANQTFDYTWDGKDAYGRKVPGTVTAALVIDYQTDPQYCPTAIFGAACGQVSSAGGGTIVTFGIRHDPVFYNVTVGTHDNGSQGLGGWGLDVVQSYDASGHQLLAGDGGLQGGVGDVNHVLARYAGVFNGTTTTFPNGDGGPARNATLASSGPMATGPDGSLYFVDGQVIRRVVPNGTISTVAGGGTPASGIGDGGPATKASLSNPADVAVGPDGSLYIADYGNAVIRRVALDGTISSVAGGANPASGNGDGGPALQAAISPKRVTVLPDGTIYVGEQCDVRRVAPDGTISTYAGQAASCGFAGDGGPAAAAKLDDLYGFAVGPDQSLYISDSNNERVRRVTPDGQISTVAGSGPTNPLPNGNCGGTYTGDGGMATKATFDGPAGIAIGPDASLYIADTCNNVIRKVSTDGVITTVAGGGSTQNPDGVQPTAASLGAGIGFVAVSQDNTLFLGGGGCAVCDPGVIWHIAQVLPGLSDANTAVPSSDGAHLYEFDLTGREVKDVDTLTGVTLYSFGYDAAGVLTTITDRDGNVTTIERDSSGKPTAIVAPGGQRTQLSLGASGYLDKITDPSGAPVNLAYGAGGLLTAYTDATGRKSQFAFDPLGRLTQMTDPGGGLTKLVRSELADGYSVAVTDAAGRKTTYEETFSDSGTVERKVTDGNGALTDAVTDPAGGAVVTYPDGSQDKAFVDPDPRFGFASPFVSFYRHMEPDLSSRAFNASRSVTLSNSSNPLSVKSLVDTITPVDSHQNALPGAPETIDYERASNTITSTTGLARKEIVTLDSKGRVVNRNFGAGLDPLKYSYDSVGRLTGVAAGSASIATFSIDSASRYTGVTNGAGQKTGFGVDSADHFNSITLPGGQRYDLTRNGNGDTTQVTMPGGLQHTLHYSAIGPMDSYTLPGGDTYGQAHDGAGAPTTSTLPSGSTLARSYDAGGRPRKLSFPQGSYTYSYSDASRRPATVSRTPSGGGTGNQMAITYNGDLPASIAFTGASAGQYDYTYDPTTLALTDLKLTVGANVADEPRTYDSDGALTGVGAFTIDRTGPGGTPASISDGTVALGLGADTQGRQASRQLKVGGTDLFDLGIVTRDGAGRITESKHTVAGVVHDYKYTYDANGRLMTVARDGAQVESYSYDARGNRLSSGAAYNDMDQLTKLGSTVYKYNQDGFLTARGGDTFSYSSTGELLSATVAGKTVSYQYDGLGRRISRTQGGVSEQYFYGDPTRPDLLSASVDASGTITQYFYDDNGLLYSFNRGGNEFAVGTDQLGTPLAVIDSTGSVVDQRTYDSYGKSLSDSNAALDLPIGFAGGLEDPLTGLVRFGARDYDAASGRFTARDPLLLGGGLDEYQYATGDPVNRVDPTGLSGANSGFGGGSSALGDAAAASAKDVGSEAASDVAKDAAKAIANGEQINPTDTLKDNISGKLVKNPADEYRDTVKDVADKNTGPVQDLFNRVSDMWKKAGSALSGNSPCPPDPNHSSSSPPKGGLPTYQNR